MKVCKLDLPLLKMDENGFIYLQGVDQRSKGDGAIEVPFHIRSAFVLERLMDILIYLKENSEIDHLLRKISIPALTHILLQEYFGKSPGKKDTARRYATLLVRLPIFLRLY